MQIVVESAVEGEKIPEWGLLEFQGSFLTRDNEPIYREFIGDLNYTKDGVPFFIVGHHILYGEEVKLPRPLAVLNKTTDEDTNLTKYLVKAVIRKKVLFKTRPKPIICQQLLGNSLKLSAKIMEECLEEAIQGPVLLISDDGHITIQTLCNGDQSNNKFFPEKLNSTKEVTVESNADELPFQKETLVNIDVKSEVLEDYMEVCITYKCKECAYVSYDQKEFHQHCLKHLLKVNTRNKQCPKNTTYVYLCSTCSEAFNSAEETKEHMIKEHNLKNEKFGCDEVPNMIKTINVSIETEKEIQVKREFSKKKRKLNEIIQSIDHGGNINNFNYFCRKRNCKYKFRNEKDLEVHEKCHLDSELGSGTKRLYQCFECNELFNGWHSCCTHLYKAHDIDCDLLKCPVCESYRTSLPLRLENHIRIHSDVRAFTCKYCGKTFKQASQLRNHVIVHADKLGGQKPNWSRSKQCNICFKMYSDSKSLKKHKEEVHSKLRPFVCSICGHASARKAMLLMHQRQHTGQKPYECQLCSFKTADHNSLRKHMMRHTGVRPYKCPHCDYTAIQSGSYKNHMRIVHPNMEGIYICSVCHYRTISEDNYIRHISDHLTGLIKDNGDTSKNSEDDNTNPPDFLCGNLFHEKHIETSEKKVDEYTNHNGHQASDDDVIDTGGITIPAEPNTSLDEELKT